MEFSALRCYPYKRKVSARQTRREIMSIKRVILANHSRLLSEMFQRVIAKAEHLEVVQEVINHEDLPIAIQRFCPEWVIISLPISNSVLDWISAFMQADPSVRFIFLSADHHSMIMKWQMTSEEDLSNLSLKEFIYLLEKDLQHI
jgi:hypothetical protein